MIRRPRIGGNLRALARWGVAALVLLGGVRVAAAGEPPVPPELEKVRGEITELENRLVSLEKQQLDLGQQRERLDTELRLAELKVQVSEEQRDAAKKAEAAAAADVAAAQANLSQALARLRSQLTMLAVLGQSGLSPLVLRAIGGGEDLPRRVTVTLALVREQKRRRDEMATLAERRAAALAVLSQRRETLDEASRELARRRGELEATRGRVAAALARLETERRSGAVALADAREAEGRLERLWGVVTVEQEGSTNGVRLLRGGLHWPAESARIVGHFGRSRDPRYGTVTLLHGLALDVPPTARITAIAGGKVVYAQFFKGYGNLVIIHHGEQIYSLYAELASMLVRAGERVAMGEPIGIAGPAADNGEGNFYLEVRVGGTAQDPLGWLKPLGR